VLGGSNPGDWPLQMAEALENADPGANIVTWDWHTDAAQPYAGMLTQMEGIGLAQAIEAELPDYTGQFHFIGHSLGSLVNCQAIETLANSGTPGQNIADTILDAPEDIPSTAGLPPGLASSNSDPIPTKGDYSTIDNYVTSFGDTHPEAENVLLVQGLTSGLIGGHSYAEQWYLDSIENPGASTVGFGTTPQPTTYYLQNLDPGAPLSVSSSNSAVLGALIAARNTPLGRASLLTLDGLRAEIEAVGNVVSSSQVAQQDGLYVTTPQVILNGPSAAYAWLPITIPNDASSISFDALLQNVPAGDSFTVGIGDQVLYTVDGSYAQEGALVNSGDLDVSQWDGQDVELFVGLFPGGSDSENQMFTALDTADSQESITVQDITFITVPEPGPSALMVLPLAGILTRRRRGGLRSHVIN
jgi:hypothetical protein